MRVEGKPELTVRMRNRTHFKRDAARHAGHVILRVLTSMRKRHTFKNDCNLRSPCPGQGERGLWERY